MCPDYASFLWSFDTAIFQRGKREQLWSCDLSDNTADYTTVCGILYHLPFFIGFTPLYASNSQKLRLEGG